MPDEVTANQIRHSRWVDTSHQLLGFPTPPLPASDFIGHIIFWDQQHDARDGLANRGRHQSRLGRSAVPDPRTFPNTCCTAISCRTTHALAARHTLTSSTPCVSYWDQPKLSPEELNRLLRGAGNDDVAFSVASFSGTPVQTIRTAIEEMRASRTPRALPRKLGGLERAMLIGQASINLSANILSALLGLLSVFVFTRLFSPHDYGIYLLGVGFASVISVFLAGWFRNLILSGHARNDGTDVRGLVISGYLICCLAAPIAYGLGRLVGLDASASLAAVVLAVAIGLFELTQDLVRARLMALTVMKATLVRAASVLGLGVVVALVSPAGFLLLLSSALAYLIAVLVQSRAAWRGTVVTFDRAPVLRRWPGRACR